MSEPRFAILFHCPRCGLTTAGAAMLPEFVNPDRPILVEHVCRHCDHAVIRQFDNVAHLRTCGRQASSHPWPEGAQRK